MKSDFDPIPIESLAVLRQMGADVRRRLPRSYPIDRRYCRRRGQPRISATACYVIRSRVKR
jgi:hypothetical protein